MWSHDISDLAETRALQTSCCFFCGHVLNFIQLSSRYLPAQAPLTCLSCAWRSCWVWCLLVLETTYVDLQAHSSLAGTSVCANPVLQSPALVVHTHPNSTVLLDVLKPALNFQYGGFHSLQSEKFAQRSAKAPKISVHSCFCFKLPIGLWRNTSSLHQLFILEEILAYSQQEVYGFSGKRMLACWLASLQFGKWLVTITAVWTNRRWRGGLLVSWKELKFEWHLQLVC